MGWWQLVASLEAQGAAAPLRRLVLAVAPGRAGPADWADLAHHFDAILEGMSQVLTSPFL